MTPQAFKERQKKGNSGGDILLVGVDYAVLTSFTEAQEQKAMAEKAKKPGPLVCEPILFRTICLETDVLTCEYRLAAVLRSLERNKLRHTINETI